MRKNWWWFRLVILSLATVALGVYLFHSANWRKALGIQPDYKARIAEGDRLVASIYAYRARTTLWPEYLDEVEGGQPVSNWFYELQRIEGGHRRPALSADAPAEGARAHLAFDFQDGPALGWHVFTASADRMERCGAPTSAATAATGPSPPSALAAALAELDRRIAREPTFIEHRQDKVSVLVLAGRGEEARTVIEAAIRDLPNAAWPRLARAQLAFMDEVVHSPATLPTDRNLDTLPAPTQEFIDWVQAHPTFTRLFGAYWHLRELRDNTRAAAAAMQALAQPIEVDSDDTHIAAFYLWDMARWAQDQGNWPLLLALCNTWQQADADGKVKDQSYFALRAVAELAQGNFPAAKADLERARHADPAWINADGASLKSLSDALTRQDRNARLAFPTSPGGFTLFVQPE